MIAEKLRPQQQDFVNEYLVDLNAKQAARRAGYSERTAEQQGYQLLQKPLVQAAIEVALLARSKRTQITADEVLKEWGLLAFADMRDYMEWDAGGVTLKASSELTEDQTRAISEIVEYKTEKTSTVRVKLHDKRGALDSVAKHLGMMVDRSQHVTGSPQEYAEAQVIQSKLRDMSLEELLDLRESRRALSAGNGVVVEGTGREVTVDEAASVATP